MKFKSIEQEPAVAAKQHSVARTPAHPGHVRGWVVTALFVLAVFYTLFLTREITLPIVLALLLHFLLRPSVRLQQHLHIPVYIASALVVVTLLATVLLGGFLLSDPIAAWMQKSPQIVGQLEHKLRPLKEKVQEVDKAAAQVEKMTKVEPTRAPAVEVRQPGIRAMLWAHIQPLLTGAVVMFFLLYFLLATGDRLLARIAALAPSRAGGQRLIDIVTGVERNVSGYLGSITLINAGLGACTAVIAYLFDMPNPLLWGAMAMLFNFVPYLGSMVTLTVLALVAVLTYDTLAHALLVPACFLLIATIEGQVITPFVLGHRLSLNPIVVFLGLIFWAWLWGPAGALLAVPVLVTLKIVCDHVPALAPVGALLGR